MSTAASASDAAIDNARNHAQLLQQWKTVGALAFSYLGLIDALFSVKNKHLTTAIDVLLTGAQSTALVSIVCATYLVWRYKDRDVEPPKLVADIPAVACYVSGALLIVTICMGRWKATAAAAALVSVLLFAANVAKMKAFGSRVVQSCSNVKSAIWAAVALVAGAARSMGATMATLVADVRVRVGDLETGQM